MRAYSIHQALEEPGRITFLALNQVDLSTTSERLSTLINLQQLELVACNLDHIPSWIGRLERLESLKFTQNPIRKIDGTLHYLPSLKKLDISQNHITSLKFDWLPGSLTRLNLSQNKLVTITANIGKLSKLEEIDLSQNKIKALPESLGLLAQLSSLNISKNKIQELPSTLGKLNKLAQANFSKNNLNTLPDSISNWEFLRSLDCSKNKISHLPSTIGKLKWLAHCSLSGNELLEIPGTLSACVQLQQLDLSENKLAKLPDIFTSLTRLYTLILDKNELSQVPNFSPALKKLSLRKNKFQQWDFSIKKAPLIETLDLRSNQLSLLVNSGDTIQPLKSLRIEKNNFSQFPLLLLKMDSLTQCTGVSTWVSPNSLKQFWKASKRKPLSDELKTIAWNILLEKAVSLSEISIEKLLELYNFPLPVIRTSIRQFLLEKKGYVKPLDAQSQISTLGKLNSTIKELKESISSQKTGFSKRITPETTHIILGSPPVELSCPIPSSISFISEQAVLSWVSKHLQRPQLTTNQIQKIEKLLIHSEYANKKLAIQLLKAHGLPGSLLTAAFYCWKQLEAGPEKRSLRKLLNQQLSELGRLALSQRTSLRKDLPVEVLKQNITRLTSNNELDENQLQNYLGIK